VEKLVKVEKVEKVEKAVKKMGGIGSKEKVFNYAFMEEVGQKFDACATEVGEAAALLETL
jgi:hypothetical protein